MHKDCSEFVVVFRQRHNTTSLTGIQKNQKKSIRNQMPTFSCLEPMSKKYDHKRPQINQNFGISITNKICICYYYMDIVYYIDIYLLLY